MTGGGYEVKSVGRVSPQQIETRSNQRSEKAKADHELKVMIPGLKSRPSGARPVRVYGSRKDKVQENSYQAHLLPEVQDDSWVPCQQTEQILKPSVNDRVTDSGKTSVGMKGHKALKKVATTPISSTRTEFDIVTPKQEDIGGLQEAGLTPPVDGPECQHTSPKGKLIYTEFQIIGRAV